MAKIRHDDVRTPQKWRSRTWQVQSKPYKAPLPFLSQGSVAKGWPDVFPAYSNFLTFEGSLPRWVEEGLETRAFEQFRDKVSDFAMLAVNVAERHQAVNSLVQRTSGATKQLENLLNRRWKAILRAAKRNGANWNKTFLEFHFGWIPLMQDVYTTARVITKPPPSGYFSGKGQTPWKHTTTAGSVVTSVTLVAGVKIKGPVWIDNPNLHLFNQLGLLNPASIAWELVPFSFVLDWFGNVNTVLSQWTDFAGVNTSLVSHTRRVDGDIVRYYEPPYPSYLTTFHSYELERIPGLPVILPALKPFNGFSPTRGATAIALLLNKANPFDSLFRRKGFY